MPALLVLLVAVRAPTLLQSGSPVKKGPRLSAQAAQHVDDWLAYLGGARLVALGEADERTESKEIEPFLQKFWAALSKNA